MLATITHSLVRHSFNYLECPKLSVPRCPVTKYRAPICRLAHRGISNDVVVFVSPPARHFPMGCNFAFDYLEGKNFRHLSR